LTVNAIAKLFFCIEVNISGKVSFCLDFIFFPSFNSEESPKKLLINKQEPFLSLQVMPTSILDSSVSNSFPQASFSPLIVANISIIRISVPSDYWAGQFKKKKEKKMELLKTQKQIGIPYIETF
jgi:hypothetical protein